MIVRMGLCYPLAALDTGTDRLAIKLQLSGRMMARMRERKAWQLRTTNSASRLTATHTDSVYGADPRILRLSTVVMGCGSAITATGVDELERLRREFDAQKDIACGLRESGT
jgi:hypothetical protein